MMKTSITLLLLLTGLSTVVFADGELPTGQYQHVTVQLKEYRFEPSQIILRTGQRVELILVNEGTVMHEFVSDAFRDLTVDVDVNGVITEALGIGEFEIPPKAKVVLRFTPEKSGEFPYTCEARKPKDHFKEGMSGMLIIR